MRNATWHEVQLGNVAELVMGQAPDGASVTDEGKGVPFLQGNAEFGAVHPTPRLICKRPMRVCEEGDVLVSVRAPVGAINVADRSYAIGRGLSAVRFKDIDSNFGRHALKYHVGQLRRVSQGTTFEAVGRKDLSGILIPLPGDRREQRRIAEILDALDARISGGTALLDKLRLLKEGAVRHALGDLQSKAKSSIGAVFEIQAGITLGPHRQPRHNSWPYLRVANVHRGYVDLADVACLEATLNERLHSGLQPGDLLVVEGHANPGEIGRCARVTGDAVGMLYQNHLFRLRSPLIEPEFGELWLNSDLAQSYWRRMCATSSGLYTINSKMLAAMPFYECPRDEQLRVVKVQREFAQRLELEARNLAALRHLKQGLMEDLLTGRVRVSEAEAVLERL